MSECNQTNLIFCLYRICTLLNYFWNTEQNHEFNLDSFLFIGSVPFLQAGVFLVAEFDPIVAFVGLRVNYLKKKKVKIDKIILFPNLGPEGIQVYNYERKIPKWEITVHYISLYFNKEYKINVVHLITDIWYNGIYDFFVQLLSFAVKLQNTFRDFN